MGDPVERQRQEPRVGEHDLGGAVGCRVAGLDGLGVQGQLLVDGRQAQVERVDDLLRRRRELVLERGQHGHQEVPHLHVHIFGGRQFRLMIAD